MFHFPTHEELLAQAHANLLNESFQIEGNVSSDTDLYISTELKGHVRCKRTVFISRTGKITGSLEAQNAVVYGQVREQVIIQKTLAVGASARLEQTVQTQQLILEQGAILAKGVKFQR
jgi:cytoskeletal protein CcmA (bactofilin family)